MPCWGRNFNASDHQALHIAIRSRFGIETCPSSYEEGAMNARSRLFRPCRVGKVLASARGKGRLISPLGSALIGLVPLSASAAKRVTDWRLSLPALICATAFVWSAYADATPIVIQLSGHVLPNNSGLPNSDVDVTGVFGTPSANLTGVAYSAIITYDPSSAPADSNATPNFGQYERDYYSGGPSFLSISVTINGHTVTVDGLSNYQEAQVDPLSPNSINFYTSNHGHDPSAGAPFDESYADFFLTGKSGQQLITSDALPTSVNLPALFVGPSQKIGDLQISRGTYEPGTNSYSAETGFLYLGLDSITSWGPSAQTPSVPEPGTFALLGLGLAGLAASRRRKQ
jgi:hypothetical protein